LVSYLGNLLSPKTILVGKLPEPLHFFFEPYKP
jgi:hypothetical protein